MPRITVGHGPNQARVIVSLCDYSGNWPRAYADAGYTVASFDLKHGDDVTNIDATMDAIRTALYLAAPSGCGRVVGILAAPPCTDFACSGAQYWKAKDADGRTDAALRVTDACLEIIGHFQGAWWALENPVGRLPKLRPATLGRYSWIFDPWQFAGHALDPEADRYTKRTCIWGTAARPAENPREPIRVCSQGSWIQKLGGKSERTKELRSMTPQGFARAFAISNP